VARSVTVTITLEVELEVPKSWAEDDVADKLSEVLNVEIKSRSKRVEVIEYNESIELDSYGEEDD
jgi:hypothetical protein